MSTLKLAGLARSWCWHWHDRQVETSQNLTILGSAGDVLAPRPASPSVRAPQHRHKSRYVTLEASL